MRLRRVIAVDSKLIPTGELTNVSDASHGFRTAETTH